MKYTIRIWDEAYYEIEADSAEQAEEIANEYFDERYHATQIVDMKEGEE